MKSRAAIAWEAGKPLVIEDVGDGVRHDILDNLCFVPSVLGFVRVILFQACGLAW
jgi:hypothetical protein